MYRGFIKPITALNGLPYGSPDLRITENTIKRDILTKASSTFTVLDIPDEAEVGNVFGCYDENGKTVYVGIITNIEDKIIQTDQIISIFNDNWKYYDPSVSTIEGKIASIIAGLAADNDSLLATIFSQFTVTTTTSTVLDLPTQSENYVTNLMDFLFSIYESYGILVDIDVSYSNIAPTITIGIPTETTHLLSDNNNVLRDFNVITETYETNKLILYSAEGAYRETWYGTPTGITQDSTAARLPKIRTNIVFSNDDPSTIVADNLSSEMYNHKIEMNLVLDNKLYDFDEFKLGGSFTIVYEKKTYASILTGYELQVNANGKSDTVKLVFGIVRISLIDKLNKLVRGQQNINSEQIRSEITSSNVTSALGYTPYDSSNPNGYTSNTGTVTSVRVQATSPVQSSTNTEQTGSLNTTISLADGYGDTKNPYASKTANYVLAAPDGSNGTPSFRKLTVADIPTDYVISGWCQGTSTSSDQAATAGTFYRVALDGIDKNNTMFVSRYNGIKVSKTGKYKISGSIYFGTTVDCSASTHIFDSNNRDYSGTSTELVSGSIYGNGHDTVVTIAPKVVTVTADHVLHLVARVRGASGTIYNSNASTYMLVEWVGE